jgi:ADP-ribosylglycohydrolase
MLPFLSSAVSSTTHHGSAQRRAAAAAAAATAKNLRCSVPHSRYTSIVDVGWNVMNSQIFSLSLPFFFFGVREFQGNCAVSSEYYVHQHHTHTQKEKKKALRQKKQETKRIALPHVQGYLPSQLPWFLLL